MPLAGTVKNQISAQIDQVFATIEAGTAFDNEDWIHNSTTFSAGGFNYVIQVGPEGDLANPSVVARIKRTTR